MSAIQVVQFKLKPEIQEDDFLAANAQFQIDAFKTLPGLQRREVGRSSDAEWVLVLQYDNLQNAQSKVPPPESGKRIFGMIDMNTMRSTYYSVVSE